MRLGSTVSGTARLASAPAIAIPFSALTTFDGKPAVWIVDQSKHAVEIRPVEVKRFEQASAIVSKGLEDGDIVVTAGVQALFPGRQVRILGASS
jgi:multidrug efflux pump subunit AcrA (membrane-fusion protein)